MKIAWVGLYFGLALTLAVGAIDHVYGLSGALTNNPNVAVYGSTMAQSCGFVLNSPNMSGAMTSCMIEPMMEKRFASSMSSMNTPGSVWGYASSESSIIRTYWICY